MPHDIVQVAGDSQALTEPCAFVKESLCRAQLNVGTGQLVASGDLTAGELSGA
jgi:hypothetical protein